MTFEERIETLIKNNNGYITRKENKLSDIGKAYLEKLKSYL